MNAIEKKKAELHEEIYKLRMDCGKDRQSNHGDDFDVLDQRLKDDFKLSHPYEMAYPRRAELENSVPAYKKGGNGLLAAVKPDGYIYRIANKIDIYSNIKSNFVKVSKDPSLDLWNRIYAESDNGKQWLPLSRFGDKPYVTASEISWWTSEEIDTVGTSVIERGIRLGLFENWITDLAYLLRCKAEICSKSAIASVPTIIDAYASSVFYTTRDNKKPIEGMTINLSKAPSLDLGINEVVLKKIELSYIEIKPVKIETGERQAYTHIGSGELPMLESLKAYYQNLP